MKVVLPEVYLMNFILGISKEKKWKVKVVLLEVSLMKFIFLGIIGDQMQCESGVTRSIIDEIHSSHIQRNQMIGQGRVTKRIIDELHSSDLVKSKVKWCYSKYHS